MKLEMNGKTTGG